MLGDFLRHYKHISNPIPLIEIGTPIVAIGPVCYQFGIYAGNCVICQCSKRLTNGISFEIMRISFESFCANNYLYEYTPTYSYNKRIAYNNAVGYIGQKYYEIRSAYGDDFVFLCMVGPESFERAFKNSAMGLHYKMPFRTKLYKAEHHAIAIEQEYVIHFSRGYDNNRTQDPIIRIDDYHNLQSAFPNQIQRVCYKNEDLNNRFVARNRATWVLRGLLAIDSYKLFTNNCEHFANWCKTGKASSTQVKQALIDTAIIAGSVLAKRPNPYVLYALKRHIF